MAMAIAMDVDNCWHYSKRREMQEVHPGLFLGPYNVANTSEKVPKLLETGITHIICVRSKSQEKLVKPKFLETFKYLTLTIDEEGFHSYNELLVVLERSCSFIKNCLLGGGRCLVHGLLGYTKSSILVVGYIIHDLGCSAIHALDVVQKCRQCVNIPNSQMTLLTMYEDDESRMMSKLSLDPPSKRSREN